MTIIERQRFVDELVGRIKSEILKKTHEMPDYWDGNELRRYVADKFDELSGGNLARGHVRARGNSARLRNYRNDVIVRNL